MDLEVKGTIETIGETVEGVNKAGDNWQKLTYTQPQTNNIITFMHLKYSERMLVQCSESLIK